MGGPTRGFSPASVKFPSHPHRRLHRQPEIEQLAGGRVPTLGNDTDPNRIAATGERRRTASRTLRTGELVFPIARASSAALGVASLRQRSRGSDNALHRHPRGQGEPPTRRRPAIMACAFANTGSGAGLCGMAVQRHPACSLPAPRVGQDAGSEKHPGETCVPPGCAETECAGYGARTALCSCRVLGLVLSCAAPGVVPCAGVVTYCAHLHCQCTALHLYLTMPMDMLIVMGVDLRWRCIVHGHARRSSSSCTRR